MSTFVMTGEIRFPANDVRQKLIIRRFSEVKIETSWKSLTDTAEITLPRNVKDFKAVEVFKEGDAVEIWLGYDGERNLKLEFQGYIKKIENSFPIVISCENEMYKMKRELVSVSMKIATLKGLLENIAKGYEVVCGDVELGAVRFSKITPAEIFEQLQKEGIYCWFEGKVLHAFNTGASDVEPVEIVLEHTASESLKQREIEKTLVIITLIRRKGTRRHVEVGDTPGGRRIVREIAGIEMSEADMRKEAQRLYELSKQPGLDGDVTLWGVPRVQHGYRMKLKSVLYPEKNGIYYIDAVTKTFGKQGYRQVCKLGLKAS